MVFLNGVSSVTSMLCFTADEIGRNVLEISTSIFQTERKRLLFVLLLNMYPPNLLRMYLFLVHVLYCFHHLYLVYVYFYFLFQVQFPAKGCLQISMTKSNLWHSFLFQIGNHFCCQKGVAF